MEDTISIGLLVQCLLASVGFLLSYIFFKASKDLNRITESLESLNVKIAVICEKVESHDERIKRLENS